MKISHSASPRNRSSRNSRSPTAGSVIAGADTTIASSLASADFASLAACPAIGSAIDVIRHRFSASRTFAVAGKDNIGPQIAHKIWTADRAGLRGCALERNYVETTMEMTAR